MKKNISILSLVLFGLLTIFNFSMSSEAEEDCFHCQTLSPDFLMEANQQLTLVKVISLAAVDSVNPCTLAVLSLMLIAILTYNPEKKRNLLLAGLAFISSVFAMYLIYGLVIIGSFGLLSSFKVFQLWLYKMVGLGAVVLGCLKIRDFWKKQAVCRVVPKLDRILGKITSPSGAFMVGAFVTIFLLPCTIGPYIVCGGILCELGILKSLPWLLFYNLIFVLPMLIVVLIIYFGFGKVSDISSWQARNIKYLDLASGIIILLLGLAMICGIL